MFAHKIRIAPLTIRGAPAPLLVHSVAPRNVCASPYKYGFAQPLRGAYALKFNKIVIYLRGASPVLHV